MNPANRFEALSIDMAQACKNAGPGSNSSHWWDELEKILLQYEEKLNGPTSIRHRPLKPEECIYDREYKNAIKKGGCFNG